MKQLFSSLLLSVMALVITNHTYAQDVITTYAGTVQSAGYSGDGGAATDAQLRNPTDIVVDKAGNIFFTDYVNQVIRKVDTFGIITTIAGTGYGAGAGDGGAYSGDGGQATDAKLDGPYALAIDDTGNIIFADGFNHIVRKISSATGIITRFAGNGTAAPVINGGAATASPLNNPVGIAVDKAGNVYISDDHNNQVHKVDAAGNITTVAGSSAVGYTGDGGAAATATLSHPVGIAIDTAGNLFIADEGNNVIRKVDKAGIITTYAGTGAKGYTGDGAPASAAALDSAQRLTFDAANNLYISDYYNNVVRMVSPAGMISTFAGTGYGIGIDSVYFSGEDSVAINAEMTFPSGVAVYNQHRIYIVDEGNEIIRLISPYVAPVVVVDHTGVHSLSASSPGLNVYPNPAHDGVFTATLASGTTEEAQISISNILGQKVYTATTSTNKQLTINLRQPAGVYFLSAITAHGQWNKQVVVDK